MHLASMDIKTAVDVARPKHFAKRMGDQDVHRMDHSGFTTSNDRPGGSGDLGKCGEYLPFFKMHPSRKRRSSSAFTQHGNGTPQKKCKGGEHQICSLKMWADNFSILFHSKTHLGADDDGLDSGGSELGLGAKTSKSVVDKHLC